MKLGHVKVSKAKGVRTKELPGGSVLLDLDERGHVVGVEFLHWEEVSLTQDHPRKHLHELTLKIRNLAQPPQMRDERMKLIPGSQLRERPSFYSFLQQLKKDHPIGTGIGDLIHDAKVDPAFPRTTRSRKQIREFLEEHDAERDCLNRFGEVWALYAKAGHTKE